MADFKFDKTNEELDFSLGGDNPNTVPKQPGKALPRPQASKPSNPLLQPKVTPRPQPTQNPGVQRPVTPTPQQQPIAQPSAQLPVKPVAQPQQQPVVQQPRQPVAPVTQQPVPPIVQNQPPQGFIQPQPQYQEPVIQPQYEQPVQPVQQVVPQYEQQYVQPDYSGNFEPAQPPRDNPQQQLQPLPVAQQVAEQPNRRRKGSAFGGGRKYLIYVRIAVALVLVIVTVAGVRSIFFPAKFPTQEQVIGVVKEDLGVTEFPTEKASGFVSGFIKAYFTYDPTLPRSEREEELSKYISDTLLDATKITIIDTSNSPTSGEDTEPYVQFLLGEPVIVDTKSVDDNNAVFTVQVNLNTGNTLYVEVPIYYDSETNGMAVSAPLSLVPPIEITQVPNDNHTLPWNNDSTVVDAFEDDLERYLEAWAASDSTSISRYVTNDATLATTSGLNGTVVFDRVEDLTVEAVDEETTNPNTRQALVSVIWRDGVSENVSYTQTYLLVIEKQSDGRWYVQDITGRII